MPDLSHHRILEVEKLLGVARSQLKRDFVPG